MDPKRTYTLSFLLFFSLFLIKHSFSQEHVIKTYPVGFLFRNYNVSYERYLNTANALQAKVGYTDYNGQQLGINGLFPIPLPEVIYKGPKIELEYRRFFQFHVLREEYSGYLGPFVNYKRLQPKVEMNDSRVDEYSIGLAIGKEFIHYTGLTLDLNFGYVHHFRNTNNSNPNDDIEDENLPGRRMTLAVGYAF